MTDLWEPIRKEEKLAKLRKRWIEAKKANDLDMCAVLERMALVIKRTP